MPSLNCRCGQKLCWGEIPNPIELLMISDNAYDSYSGTVDTEELYGKMRSILKCPVCERLWVFWNGFDNEPKSYNPE